jgi:maleate isomerase
MTAARDNWGWRARIGMFIVGNEAVPEAEWWAMAPPGVSVHAARVISRSPWPLEGDFKRGAEHFAVMRLQAVVLGHTTSSFIGGKGWDEKMVADLTAIVGKDKFVTTNGLDMQAALRASGIKRPFLVVPPWFNDANVAAGFAYLGEGGFAPAGHYRYDPGRNWRDVPSGEMYAQGMGFAQEIEPLYAQIRAACPKDTDGVLIGGTGFRCVGILEALEQDLKRPVITANQASLWHCLRSAGVRAEIGGYGSLLRL